MASVSSPTTSARAPSRWRPRLSRDTGPLYRAIADALEADIRGGRLAAGDALPPQRDLAEQLGVNFTTITRAYAEARARGLITARVGSGTFVAARTPARTPARAPARRAPVTPLGTDAAAEVDLSVNAPPVPAWMAGALRAAVARVGGDPVVTQQMLSYESRHGDAAARDAGVAWLRARGLDAAAERVVVTAGAQHALSLLLGTVARRGDVVLVEALCYPGLQSAAAAAGVRLVGVALDDEGIRPDALDEACRRHGPAMLLCVPSLQNPTTAVMSLARRREIAAVVRRHGVPVVEDDICGPLLRERVPPLATLAPELVTYVGSVSKCVAPGLRTAFVLAPSTDDALRLQSAVRATILMLSPLTIAVAAAWIADGTAERAIRDIAAEAAARDAAARRILGASNVRVPDGSLHAWLRLPSAWSVAAFVAQAQQHRIRVAPSDWYVMPRSDGRVSAPPNAVRLTLGAVPDRARLEQALQTLATIVERPPAHCASNV